MTLSNLSEQAKLLAPSISTKLPPLSRSARELLELSTADKEDPRLLAVLANKDPICSARLLSIANSALYAHAGAVTTVAAAAKRLGAAQTYESLLAVALLSSFAGASIPEDAKDILMVSTLSMMVTTRRFVLWARLGELERDILSLASMLYCTGLFAVINQEGAMSTHYLKAIESCVARPYRCLVLDERLYGTLYFSAEVAKAWGMRNDVTDALFRAGDEKVNDHLSLLVNAPAFLIRAKLLRTSQKAVIDALVSWGALSSNVTVSDEIDLAVVL